MYIYIYRVAGKYYNMYKSLETEYYKIIIDLIIHDKKSRPDSDYLQKLIDFVEK